jgi:hypothetical protein
MADDDIVQRIVIEGGDEAQKVFTEIAKGAAQAFGQLEGALEQATAAFVGLGAAAVAIGGALIGGLLALTENASRSAEAIEKLSSVTGASVEGLSALSTAAAKFGIGGDEIIRAVDQLSRRLGSDLPAAQEALATSANKLTQSQIAVAQAQNAVSTSALTAQQTALSLAAAQTAQSRQAQDFANQEKADAFSVADAQTNLARLRIQLGVQNGTISQEEAQDQLAQLARSEQVRKVAEAELALNEKKLKQQRDLEDERQKAAEAAEKVAQLQQKTVTDAIEAEQKRLDLVEKQHAAQQAAANDIVKFKQYFDDLAKGGEASLSGLNASTENLRKGVIASLGDGSKALEGFSGHLHELGDTQATAALLKLADIFKAMPDGVNKTALAMQLFGRSAGPDMARFLSQGSEAILAEEQRLKDLGLVLTDVESHNLDAFRKAQNQLGSELDVVKEKFAAAVAPSYTALLQTATRFVEEHGASIVKMGESANQVLGKLGDAWNAVLPAMKLVGTVFSAVTDAGAAGLDKAVKAVEALTDALAGGLKFAVETVMHIFEGLGAILANPFQFALIAVDALITGVASLIDKVLTFLGLKSQATGTGTAPADTGGGLPMARGGLISGPGTTTSDSIFARLSRGEFVINAAAVSHFGANFFAGLNALHAPALPRMGPMPAFASGGLVSTGRTLHVTLGNETFRGLVAPEPVALAMERFAVHSQLSSGGRKQSWRR